MTAPHAPQDARGATFGVRVGTDSHQRTDGPENGAQPRCLGHLPDQLPPMCERICWPCSIDMEDE